MNKQLKTKYFLFSQLQYFFHILNELKSLNSNICLNIDIFEKKIKRRYNNNLRFDIDENIVKN